MIFYSKTLDTYRHFIKGTIRTINGPGMAADFPAYLMSLWRFAWAGGGGTKEPVMTQGAPEAGREVGLMYSFSSQSDSSFSPLVTTDAGRDLENAEQGMMIFTLSFVVYATFLRYLRTKNRHKIENTQFI